MPVTSDSARVQFTLGSFDVDTTLTIPSEDAENKVSLTIDELISPQLSGWGSNLPYTIYGLIKVYYADLVDPIYENADWASPSEDDPPTDPDLTITPDTSPATVETTVINNYVPLILEADGTPAAGTYSVEIKFVYKISPTLWETEDETVFTATVDPSQLEPVITYNWDTMVPVLRVQDTQNYDTTDDTISTSNEFVLYPPENRASITNVLADNQNIQYSSPWIGGNEVRYTIEVSKSTTTSLTLYVKQDYASFTVSDIDRCAIYECLNEQYELYMDSTCSGRLRAERERNFQKANSLALQIITGQSCGTTTLSGLVEEFNELCGCNICLDDTPRQLTAPNITPQDSVQLVNATTDELEIDFSAGSTAIVTLANSESGTTLIDAINYEEYGQYRLIFIRGFGAQVAEFQSYFVDSDGQLNDITPTLGNKIIVDLFASTSSELNLVNRNDGSY